MRETTVESSRTLVNSIPEKGRFTAEVFARFFDIEVKTLKKHFDLCNIRRVQFGSTWIVVAEWFWEDLFKVGGDFLKGD